MNRNDIRTSMGLMGVLLIISCILGSLSPSDLSDGEIAPISSSSQGFQSSPVVITIIPVENAADLISLKIQNLTWIRNGIYPETFSDGDLVNSTYMDNLISHSYAVVNASESTEIFQSGIFEYNSSAEYCYSKEISTTDIPDSDNLAILTNFTLNSNDFSVELSSNFTVSHKILIDFNYLYSQGDEFAHIYVASAIHTYKSLPVDNSNIETATFEIHDKTSQVTLLEGELSYSGGETPWEAEIPVSELPKGETYAVVKFKTTLVSSIQSTPNEWVDVKNGVTNISFFDQYGLYIIIGASLFVVLIVGINMYIKKQKASLDRQSGKQKQKGDAIEIVDISKIDFKKTKLGPKKKVKKMDEKGLIFNVPTWDVDDDDKEQAAASATGVASTATSPVAQGYTLHCPGCNSWFEIDDYEKLKCPKCKTMLEVAMWCESCSKWFDVPEPMDAGCPICSNKLNYSK